MQARASADRSRAARPARHARRRARQQQPACRSWPMPRPGEPRLSRCRSAFLASPTPWPCRSSSAPGRSASCARWAGRAGESCCSSRLRRRRWDLSAASSALPSDGAHCACCSALPQTASIALTDPFSPCMLARSARHRRPRRPARRGALRRGAARIFHPWRRCAMTNPHKLPAGPMLEVRDLRKSYDEAASKRCAASICPSMQANTSPSAGPAAAANPPCCNLSAASIRAHQRRGSLQQVRSWVRPSISTLTARSQIGFIFQAFYLMPTLRAIENVQVPMLRLQWRFQQPRRDEPRRCSLRWAWKHRMNHYPNRTLRRRTAARSHCPRAGQRSRHAARRRAHRQSRQRKLGAHHGDADRHSARSAA